MDARVLARMGEALPLRRVDAASSTQRQLEELKSARDALVKDRTAARSRGHQARLPSVKRQLRQRLAEIDGRRRILGSDGRRASRTENPASLRSP